MKKLLNGLEPLLGRHKQKIVYLFVGGLLFLIDFMASLAGYYLLDLRAGVASALGFLASFMVGFTLNRKVVFKHDKQAKFSIKAQVALYLTLAFINLFLTSWMVDISVSHGLAIYIIKPLVVVAAACWNYVILGKYIFAHKKEGVAQ